jgi:hypothetical protein
MRRRIDIRAGIGLAMLITASLACNAQLASSPTAVVQEPSVVFIAPENNSVIAEGAEITLAVNVVDTGADVSKVEFRVDDNPIGTQPIPAGTGQTSFTVRQAWPAKGIQGHLVAAIAYRSDGTAVGSAQITLQVVAAAAPSATVAAPLPGSDTPAARASLGPSATPAQSAVLPPSATPPAPVPSARPNQPLLKVTNPNLNIRAGPGVNYPIIGSMQGGDTAIIVGRNADRSWWVVVHDQIRGWVISLPAYSQVVGDTSNVPLVASPPTPISSAAQPTAVPTLAVTSTTGPVADLVFDSVTLDPATPTANQTFTVTIVIRNQGTVDAGTSLVVGIFQPGNERSPVAVPAIPAGQTVTVKMPVTLHASGANQTGVLTLDVNSDISEGPNGEANNTKTITYNVN